MSDQTKRLEELFAKIGKGNHEKEATELKESIEKLKAQIQPRYSKAFTYNGCKAIFTRYESMIAIKFENEESTDKFEEILK